MKITILSENTSTLDTDLGAEWGFSAFVESGGKNILFDTGASGLFIENAKKLGVGLGKTDFLVISHGHWDHTGGVQDFIKRFDTKGMTLIAHPGAFGSEKKEFKGCVFSDKPVEFTPGAIFLGEVARTYEDAGSGNKDDSAAVFKTEKGGVLVTGCSHSGVLNLAKAAEKEVGHIHAIIGGFHLGDASAERLECIISGFKELDIGELRPGHCTGDTAIAEMEQGLGARRITTGEVIEI